MVGTDTPVVTRQLLMDLGLTAAGVEYVLDTGSSEPARKVGRKRRRNLILDVPMASVPVVLQAESLTGEFMFLTELDGRPDMVAAYDQPLSIQVRITNTRGVKTRTSYTADYLVVHMDRVRVYEVKPDHVLESLHAARPADWTRDHDGYHYEPATDHYRTLGIEHVIVPVSTLNQLRADNLRILSGMRGVSETRALRNACKRVIGILENERTVRMDRVLELLGNVDTTPVLYLLFNERIHADIDRATLTDPASIWLSLDRDLARLAQECSMHLLDAIHQSGNHTPGAIDPRYEAHTAVNYAIAKGTSRTRLNGKAASDRTARRMRSALNAADGDPAAVTPKYGNCGLCGPRIGFQHQAYIASLMCQARSLVEEPTISSVYSRYTNIFEDADSDLDFIPEGPVSRSTFYSYWSRTSIRYEEALAKGGRRLANAESDAFDPGARTLIATHPFAVAHIDHWKTDLYLFVGIVNGKVISRRPWLTAMVDAFSGEILAIWLSYSDPSRKACTMVIRDCIRRHKRLPRMIVVDGGSDFRSNHFFVMLACLKVVRCERPPEDPRFGVQVERVLLDFKERFARGLPGFGISIERARAVSAAFKAHNNAKLNLLQAFEAFEAFCFKGYNHCPKPGEVSSRFAIGDEMRRRLPRCGVPTSWSLKLMIQTSIEAPKAKYTLWKGQGVHVLDRWYSSPALLAYFGHKKHLDVRLEPYSDSHIYVCVAGKWFVCASSSAPFTRAISDAALVQRSAQWHDLSALREELSQEMNRFVAEIVNSKLEDIAARSAAETAAATASQAPQPDADPEEEEEVSFDDIEPYDNEAPE